MRTKVHKCIVIHRFALFFFLLISCNEYTHEKKQEVAQSDTFQILTNIKHCSYSEDTAEICKCPIQYELEDSLQLSQVKDVFYRNRTGHLYERTIRDIEVNGHLADDEYFAGDISQDVDPLTFEPLDGWYAKDKNYVYYYRPLSGGMQIFKMDKADCKTFNVLDGHYKYASDKNFFYDDMNIIEGFKPDKTSFKLDNKGRIKEMTCTNKSYKFELVDED